MYRYKTVSHTYWLAVFSFSCLFIAESRRIKRIIGGEVVTCGSQIRVASLRNSSNSHHLCGATILSRNYAITAAHCVQDTPQSYYLQLNNYCSDEEQIPTARVLNITRNYMYSPFSHEHDIAVLRVELNLADMASLNGTILPETSFGISGLCKIYGYGINELYHHNISESLQCADVKLISLDECTSLLGSTVAPGPLSGMLCAMGDGADACQGDSGGPLMCSGVIEGLTSYGLSCNVPGIPAVYVSIGRHLNWLRNIINENE